MGFPIRFLLAIQLLGLVSRYGAGKGAHLLTEDRLSSPADFRAFCQAAMFYIELSLSFCARFIPTVSLAG